MGKTIHLLAAILLTLGWMSCGGNEVQKYDEGFYESGTFYYFNGGTGTGNLVNGKKDGKWTFFDKEDHKLAEGKFREGIEEGPWKYWNAEGKLTREGAYLDGKQHGHWKFFYDDGTLESEGDFMNGLHTGIWQFYHFNAQRRSVGLFENGKRVGQWEFWYNNGQQQEIRNYQGEENILKSSWTENGEPMVVDGTGPYEYWEFGELKEKGYYKEGKMDGQWSFYDGGLLVKEETFEMGKKAD